MKLHADPEVPAFVPFDDTAPWLASPEPGVHPHRDRLAPRVRRRARHARHVPAGSTVVLPASETELLVVDGRVRVGERNCGRWAWLRSPTPIAPLEAITGSACWIKQGHLGLRPASTSAASRCA